MTMTKNKLYHMVLAGILCAIGIIVPMFMPRIVLGPMSFTLASHVAVFLGMFISPAVAVAVCIGTTIGFFLTTPAIIALRAASHIVFAFIGAAYLKRNPDIINRPVASTVFNFIIALLHAAWPVGYFEARRNIHGLRSRKLRYCRHRRGPRRH